MPPPPSTLRVVHCIYDDPRNPWVGGGGAVRVFEIYRRLTSAVSATVVTGSFPGARDEVVDGVRYMRVGARAPYAWSRLSYARAARRLLRRARYDAAVFDFSTYTPLLLPADRPVGVTVHHAASEGARERWGALAGLALDRLERALLRPARWLTATTPSTLAWLEPRLPSGARTMLVEAGVPDELFALERRPEDYILFFGRLDVVHKGLDTLLSTMASLALERPGVRLRIAGRGRDATRLRAMVRQLGVESNVSILGPVPEMERQALFAGALLVVMPSRFEGFGLVAAEAMAAGIPLVASDIGALRDVVGAGGVLVPPGDAPALASAIGALLDDRD
ncbi:MAG TPA: glycosyltransferase family 4 protein, partial [Gemmatimonadaceae bacterium]|nr:glycosyltransferase family 4 protein [Gemmatimonadaceae bacterium]